MQSSNTANHPRIAWKKSFPIVIIIANTFSWYGLTYLLFAATVTNLQLGTVQTLSLFSTFYIGVAFSAILVSIPRTSTTRSSFLVWILMGSIASLLLEAMNTGTYLVAFAVSLFFGISIGVGLPSCLAYFTDSTIVESRGSLGGIAWAMSSFIMVFLTIAVSTISLSSAILVLAMWRGLGLVPLIFLMKAKENREVKAIPSYLSVLRNRTVVLCLVPWIMFCVVNWIEIPLLQNLMGDFYNFAGLLGIAISGISALINGFLADLVGRKRLIITGFILLGVEYAALSLMPKIQASWYLYAILDGVTWGMFSVVFFMTLWGDLAGNMKREKYYVIGGLPYLLGNFMSILIQPLANVVPVATAFSLASFFLFLAVLPLMYAPETLPEKKIRDRELKQYIEKAKKTREKYA
jgi:hypothetical protein